MEIINFYPRSPCGERRQHSHLPCLLSRISIHALLAESDSFNICVYHTTKNISIHALLAESDLQIAAAAAGESVFLSTLSLRRATKRIVIPDAGISISIHALLAESDGEHHANSQQGKKFLSTLSLRRATLTSEVSDRVPLAISIHALLAESDVINKISTIRITRFLSTLSLRRATKPIFGKIDTRDFYPRSPCGERRQ